MVSCIPGKILVHWSEKKKPLQEHSSVCHCSGCFLAEQEFGLASGRDNRLMKFKALLLLGHPQGPSHHKHSRAATIPSLENKSINHRADGAGCWWLYSCAVPISGIPCFTKLLSARDKKAENERAQGVCMGWGTFLKGLTHTQGNTLCILGHEGCCSWWEQCRWS